MKFSRATSIDRPLEAVWAFHSRIDGLDALTPAAADLVVEDLRTVGDDDRLLAGSEIDLSVGPLPGVARTTWTSVIVDRQRTDTEAWFVDEMREGPMASWRHTHHFVADGDRTRLIDRIDYKTGRGRAVDLALRPILAIAFAMRQQRTREILSGDEV